MWEVESEKSKKKNEALSPKNLHVCHLIAKTAEGYE